MSGTILGNVHKHIGPNSYLAFICGEDRTKWVAKLELFVFSNDICKELNQHSHNLIVSTSMIIFKNRNTLNENSALICTKSLFHILASHG